MLETVDLNRKLSKAQYKQRLPALQTRLHLLQRACWEHQLASIVLFEGWKAAGKGAMINKLTERLEPRAFTLHAIREPRTYELPLPWLWRFWQRLPRYGEMAIFDRSWYRRVLAERVAGLTPEHQVQAAYRDITTFARALAEDRYVLVKLFLHIDRSEQKKRLKALERDPRNRWRVQEDDWEEHRRYDEHRIAAEEMLARTESEHGPWTLIEATDRRWARVRMFEAVLARLEAGLQQRGLPLPDYPTPEAADAAFDSDLDA